MGVLAPVSAHAGPSAQHPIGTSGNFRFHQISPLSGQNRVNWGCRGGPPNIFFIGFLIFLLVRSPCKNLKSYDTPLCHFSNGGNKKIRRRKEEEEKRKTLPKIVPYGSFDKTVCTAPHGPIHQY